MLITRDIFVKKFTWSEKKNKWLKKHRNISFEEVLERIADHILDVKGNIKHKDQKLFIIDIHNYPWVVPFKETKDEIFLITAFPDRRLKEEFGYE